MLQFLLLGCFFGIIAYIFDPLKTKRGVLGAILIATLGAVGGWLIANLFSYQSEFGGKYIFQYAMIAGSLFLVTIRNSLYR